MSFSPIPLCVHLAEGQKDCSRKAGAHGWNEEDEEGETTYKTLQSVPRDCRHPNCASGRVSSSWDSSLGAVSSSFLCHPSKILCEASYIHFSSTALQWLKFPLYFNKEGSPSPSWFLLSHLSPL